MGAFDKVLDVLGFKEQPDEEDTYTSSMAMGPQDYDEYEDIEPSGRVERRTSNRSRFSGVRSILPTDDQDYGKVVEEDMRIVLLQPMRFEEAQNIAHNLLQNKVVVFDLQECDINEAVNIVNFVSGAVFAMDGSIQKINDRGAIFVAVPPSVGMESELHTEFEDASYGPTIAEWVNRTRSKADF